MTQFPEHDLEYYFDTAHELAERVAAQADQIDEERQIPPELAGDIADAFPLPKLESTLAFQTRSVKRSRSLRIDLKASFPDPIVGRCPRTNTVPIIEVRCDWLFVG